LNDWDYQAGNGMAQGNSNCEKQTMCVAFLIVGLGVHPPEENLRILTRGYGFPASLQRSVGARPSISWLERARRDVMLKRREFLKQALRSSSLLAIGAVVPEFVARTARAAEAGKDQVLVVIELTGGNDGLNTVIPYADDLYHKARPKLHYTKDEVVRIDDHVGLHPAMRNFGEMLQKGQLAVVQGVGYPNPNRSHFESMDVWQSADPQRRMGSGWIARSCQELQGSRGAIPAIHLGPKELPLALQGAPGGVVSLGTLQNYQSEPDPAGRKRLREDLAKPSDANQKNSMLAFVQRRQLQTYATLDRLREFFHPPGRPKGEGKFVPALVAPNPDDEQISGQGLAANLKLIARFIAKGFGTRVFYVSLDGFDTHAGQREQHASLLGQLADSIAAFFEELRTTGQDKRVLALTFSEFGRRARENGSGGTDHGAASCLFVAGPAVKAGLAGGHPSLKDLDGGDLKFHTDFRRVYATLLDRWLGCDSKVVLGATFDQLNLVKSRA
jgi:uncharacterized protein (DUF1501 family)